MCILLLIIIALKLFLLSIYSEIMSYPVVCVRSVVKVGYLEDILKKESHNGFPVVDITEVRFLMLKMYFR